MERGSETWVLRKRRQGQEMLTAGGAGQKWEVRMDFEMGKWRRMRGMRITEEVEVDG